MTEYLKFEITDAKIERLIDETTSLCSFRVIKSGTNSHNLPISIDVIKEAAESSLRGKPILASYSNWERDLEGHKPADESNPIGYFLESQDFLYENVEDGETALFAYGLLWKRYAPKQFDAIFSSKNHSKNVSMEIAITSFVDENDKSKGIASFKFLGLAVLGDEISPASENAHVTLLTFSEMKNKYETLLFSSNLNLTIDNSKENAFMNEGKWSNSGRSLYGKMVDASNGESLANEAYLQVDNGWKDSPSAKLHYPHHKWRGNVLCVSRAGIEAANSRLQAQGITSGSEIDHLKRHYRELGLNVESFSAEFGEKEENTLDKVMMEKAKEEPKFAEVEPEKEKPAEEAKEEEKPEAEEKKKEEVDYACKFAEVEKQNQEYAAKFEAQEKELFELRKFKADKEEQDKNYAIEQLMSEVSDSLPADKTEEFRAEAKELPFSEFAAFSNKVKACTLDFVKKVPQGSGLQIMATSTPEKAEKKSVWGFSK